MFQKSVKKFRIIKQLGIKLDCYFYGYFKSPGLKKYPECNWVNSDFNLIKSNNITNEDIERISTNLFMVGIDYNLFSEIDYIIMMPMKKTSISNLPLVINNLVNKIKINTNSKIVFLENVFEVMDYKKFWENKLNLVERKNEIFNKISLKKQYYDFFNGKKILIIDDVVSTGISIADIALLLLNNNDNISIEALCYGSVYKWNKIYT